MRQRATHAGHNLGGMDDESYPALRDMQADRVRAAVSSVLTWMGIAAGTAYRARAIDEIAWALESADQVLGVAPWMLPRRKRALLLAVSKPVASTDGLRAYVELVVRGARVSELQVCVVATGSVELVRRLRRYGSGCDREMLSRIAITMDVMAA